MLRDDVPRGTRQSDSMDRRMMPCGILSSMPQLFELYALSEMARTREGPMWAVLDWAAQQDGDFTFAQLYSVFTQSGGGSSPTSFHTMVGHMTAKDWKEGKLDSRGKPYWPPSVDRPFVLSRRGHRGKGGAHSFQWGLDGPLRDPQAASKPEDNEDDDPVSIAMDALEQKMGAPALKAAMARWKKMGDMRQITADVRGLPAKMQMNALLVASQHLMDADRADEEDVEDAEQQLSPAAQAEPVATPFSPGRPKANPPRSAVTASPTSGGVTKRPKPAITQPVAQAEPEDDDPAADWADDSADKTQPDAASPFAADDSEEEPAADDSEGFDDDVPDEFFDDPDAQGEEEPTSTEEESPDEIETPGYPDWLPPAKKSGTKGEQAMYRLVDLTQHGGAEIGAADDLWDELEAAEDEQEAVDAVIKLFRKPGYIKKFLPDAIAVAREVMSGTSEEEEEPAGEDSGDEGEPEQSDEEPSDEDSGDEGGAEEDYPSWLPQPEEDGSLAETSMFRLMDESGIDGFDEFNPFFEKLRKAKDSVDAHRIITASPLPKHLGRAALAVAKAIFQHDGRDWDTGKPGAKKESRGLSRFFRLNEATEDDIVPSPSKRPIPGPGRTLPDYGMDEGPNMDPVDFAQKSGLQRILKLRKR